jgi:hypothetical protein
LVSLARLSEGRTTFWISHHLAAVSHVGHIIYMSEGRILEEGTHDELMALDGGHAATYRVHAADSNSTAKTVATAEGTTQVFLLWHGESTWYAEGRCQGSDELVLTEQGRRTATCAAIPVLMAGGHTSAPVVGHVAGRLDSTFFAAQAITPLRSSRADSRGRNGGPDNQVELLGALTFPETQ